jgi:hypothetical protein
MFYVKYVENGYFMLLSKFEMLGLVMEMHCQSIYTLQTFPYDNCSGFSVQRGTVMALGPNF